MGRLDFNQKLTPETVAQEIIKSHDIIFPINLKELCMRLNITYIEEPLSEKFEGCSHRIEENYGIIIDPTISNKKRKKFTLAHEIGHIKLNHLVSESTIRCVSENIENYNANDQHERESNAFASELILPSDKIIAEIKKNDISFDLVEIISDKYGSSFTAAAVKVVKLSDLPCILVMAKNKRIEWAIFSEDIKYKYRIPQTSLPEFSAAINVYDSLANQLENTLEASEWLEDGDDCIENLDFIKEHSIYYPNYNRSLSLLILPDICLGETSL